MQDEPTKPVTINRYQRSAPPDAAADQPTYTKQTCDDLVAVEEPLEIRIAFGSADQRRSKSLAITMRTPGNDIELATGFLLSENVIQSASQIQRSEHVGPSPENGTHGNTLIVDLDPSVDFTIERLQRHFYMTSSCGVCGKASIEAVMAQGFKPVASVVQLTTETIASLPSNLRTQQNIFDDTGGLHAAGLFSRDGQLIDLREDVGRHNAVDKLVGKQLIDSAAGQGGGTMTNSVLVVSGRASFELVQKAVIAQIPMMVAVGAPSSLAIDLANRFGLTLVGFNTGKKFNVYSCGERIE